MPLSRRASAISALCLATGFLALPPLSQAVTPVFNGDVRLRYENDWDSHTGNGTRRDDRERARIRVRLQGSLKFSDTFSFVARVRTGNRDSQQSPHLTFWGSDDQTDDLRFAFDQYYLLYKTPVLSAWAGRNTFPFWQQNEFVWDEDVTPTGAAVSYSRKVSQTNVVSTAGAFALPDGALGLNGSMVGAQLRTVTPVEKSQVTVAGSFYSLNGRSGAKNLRNRNGARDYLIAVLSAQWTTPLAQNLPLSLGVDLIRNFESYSAAEAAPFAASQRNQKDGYVLSATVGQLKKRGDWLVGYYYGYIETLAINASYTEDDWARFGNGPQSDLTDIKGSELRLAYALSPTLNLMARGFDVQAISSRQDGKRVRVDLNWKF
jgi:Putative porin